MELQSLRTLNLLSSISILSLGSVVSWPPTENSSHLPIRSAFSGGDCAKLDGTRYSKATAHNGIAYRREDNMFPMAQDLQKKPGSARLLWAGMMVFFRTTGGWSHGALVSGYSATLVGRL